MIYLSERAVGHLNAINLYMIENEPDYAVQVLDMLYSAIYSLNDMPERGVKLEDADIQNENIRYLLCPPYKISYQVEDSGNINILAVIHMRQNLRF